MAKNTRSWWGQAFLEALESVADPGRLSRGRSYASGHRIKSFEMDCEQVTAQVRGNINPYFGVYTEPTYNTEIEFTPISRAKWTAVIAQMASKVSTLSQLLVGEMPDDIEACFDSLGLSLLPRKRSDFKSQCSCPDWGNPCKHVAGVYYRVAAELDRDPLKLFELRGLSREELHDELAKTPLGMALVAELAGPAKEPEAAESLYTQPQLTKIDPATQLKDFWQGQGSLPTAAEQPQSPGVSAILIKKQGDFPPFWDRNNSFIEAMDALYKQVRTKNGALLD